MKKKVPAILLFATLLCIAVYIGVFIGRTGANKITFLPDPVNHSQKSTEPTEICVDLNKATADELVQLPGVNRRLANAIIRYREDYGNYVLVSELMDVEGMTDEIYDQIKSYVAIYP